MVHPFDQSQSLKPPTGLCFNQSQAYIFKIGCTKKKKTAKKPKNFGWGTLELWMSSDHILVSYWQNAHNSKLALWPELDCLWLMWEAISSLFLSCTHVQYPPWLNGEWKKLHSRGAKQGRHLQSICEATGLITMLMSQANLKYFGGSVDPQLWWFIIPNNVDIFLAVQDSARGILNNLKHFYYEISVKEVSVCCSCLDRELAFGTSHLVQVTIKTEQSKVWKVKAWKDLMTRHAMLLY